MVSINVLISTMNRNNLDFYKKMNVKSPTIIANQLPSSNLNDIDIIEKNRIKLINVKDRGISNSRNLLIDHSDSDISVLADDDLVYTDNFSTIVKTAYNQFHDADIIVFQVPRVGKNSSNRAKSYSNNVKMLNYLTSMKVSAVEITFKTQSIKKNGIRFNPNISIGTEFMMGEENQFLFDCLRAGLKILYLPYVIAEVDVSDSSWFEGYDEEYFVSTGAKFYNMSKRYYPLLILQFALRKRSLYSNKYSFKQVTKLMYDGVKKYKRKHEW